MPLNTLRLNHQASSHPNDRIVFIKPLTRSSTDQTSYDTADLILRAIAAQCLPIMKNNYLSVTTLEEHEPNPEFIGRNFNNGEVIQLVLKSKNGAWLPVNVIQMVMMHELAHNVHMNHGKGFWATRNRFAEEMRGLWAKGYTGDGLWSTGRTVSDLGRAMSGNIMASEQLKDLPLCGGTYRSKGRKRKRTGEDLTWREKRDRRIEKKFGKNGVALGEDDAKRLRLEIESKGPMGVKPRVAQSKRGRELRVAAVLARFGTNKQEVGMLEATKDEDRESDEQESEWDEHDAKEEDAIDTSGHKVLDGSGNGMIRVCGREDADEVAVKQELDELEELSSAPRNTSTKRVNAVSMASKPKVADFEHAAKQKSTRSQRSPPSLYDIPQYSEPSTPTPLSSRLPQDKQSTTNKLRLPKTTVPTSLPDKPAPSSLPTPTPPNNAILQVSNTQPVTKPCPICSMENSLLDPTCLACANVLDPRKDPRHWRCKSTTCKTSQYINAGDCGICGICGERRAAQDPT